jgi:hypothetical protein
MIINRTQEGLMKKQGCEIYSNCAKNSTRRLNSLLAWATFQYFTLQNQHLTRKQTPVEFIQGKTEIHMELLMQTTKQDQPAHKLLAPAFSLACFARLFFKHHCSGENMKKPLFQQRYKAYEFFSSSTFTKTSFFYALFFFALTGCDLESSTSKKSTLPNFTSEVFSMNKLCDIPENLPDFSAYIYKHYGAEMSEATVKKLLPDFTVLKDAPTKDALYSRTEELRLIGLSKKCRAADGVEYEWRVLITHKLTGEPFFHQMYLLYAFSDIYEGKRKFSFNHFYGSGEEMSKLVTKEAIGKSRDEIASYIKNLGVRLVKNNEFSEEYSHDIDMRSDMSSRLAVYDFSKTIRVSYDSTQRVAEVDVSF